MSYNLTSLSYLFQIIIVILKKKIKKKEEGAAWCWEGAAWRNKMREWRRSIPKTPTPNTGPYMWDQSRNWVILHRMTQ